MRLFANLVVLFATSVGTVATLGAQTAPAKASGFRGFFLEQLKDVETKVVGLAQAMPQEKYGWRPGPGVRSVSEVYMHIAGANYMLPTFIGVKPPAGALKPNDEKNVTEKAQVIAAVKNSFAHIRAAVENLSDADLAKQTKAFGQQMTYQDILFFTANHMHEHLGQSIAYARTNGVVPPWSQGTGATGDR